jgi:hypothetical protein
VVLRGQHSPGTANTIDAIGHEATTGYQVKKQKAETFPSQEKDSCGRAIPGYIF